MITKRNNNGLLSCGRVWNEGLNSQILRLFDIRYEKKERINRLETPHLKPCGGAMGVKIILNKKTSHRVLKRLPDCQQKWLVCGIETPLLCIHHFTETPKRFSKRSTLPRG